MGRESISRKLTALWAFITWVTFSGLLALVIGISWYTNSVWVVPVGIACLLGFGFLLTFYFRAYVRNFQLEYNNDELLIKKGVFWKRQILIPWAKVTNINILQGPVDRLFGVSNIQIETAGSSNPYGYSEGIIPGIEDADRLRQQMVSLLNSKNER